MPAEDGGGVLLLAYFPICLLPALASQSGGVPSTQERRSPFPLLVTQSRCRFTFKDAFFITRRLPPPQFHAAMLPTSPNLSLHAGSFSPDFLAPPGSASRTRALLSISHSFIWRLPFRRSPTLHRRPGGPFKPLGHRHDA